MDELTKLQAKAFEIARKRETVKADAEKLLADLTSELVKLLDQIKVLEDKQTQKKRTK